MAEPLVELGRRLKAAREAKGWTLQQASERTRITAKNLAAIEAGDLSRFPAPVYVRGFVRSYANALDLDENAELRSLDEAGFTAPSTAVSSVGAPAAAAEQVSAGAPVARPRLVPAPGTLVTAGVVLVAALAGGLGIRALVRMSRPMDAASVPPSPFQPHSAAPSGGHDAPVPSPAAPAVPPAKPAVSGTPVSIGVLLSVTAHAMCEMQYQPDTQRARWMTLKPGETAVLKAKSQLRLLIGNPAGVEMSTYQGPVPLPKKSYRAEHLMITTAGIQKLALPVPSSTLQ